MPRDDAGRTFDIPALSARSVAEDAFETIQAAVGQIIISFAMLDMVLDLWLVEVFPRAVHRNVASKMPYQLGHKLETLRKSFERVPELQGLKEEVLPLLGEIGRLNEIRNTFAHGSLSHAEGGDDGSTFIFAKLSYDKDRGAHLYADTILSLEDILGTSVRLPFIIHDMHAVAARLMEMPEDGKAPKRGPRVRR